MCTSSTDNCCWECRIQCAASALCLIHRYSYRLSLYRFHAEAKRSETIGRPLQLPRDRQTHRHCCARWFEQLAHIVSLNRDKLKFTCNANGVASTAPIFRGESSAHSRIAIETLLWSVFDQNSHFVLILSRDNIYSALFFHLNSIFYYRVLIIISRLHNVNVNW